MLMGNLDDRKLYISTNFQIRMLQNKLIAFIDIYIASSSRKPLLKQNKPT